MYESQYECKRTESGITGALEVVTTGDATSQQVLGSLRGSDEGSGPVDVSNELAAVTHSPQLRKWT